MAMQSGEMVNATLYTQAQPGSHDARWREMQNQIYVYEGEEGTVTQQASPETSLDATTDDTNTPRHTGMRYDVVERTPWCSYGSTSFQFDYVTAASFLLPSDARAFINCREHLSLGEFLLIDAVEGKIL